MMEEKLEETGDQPPEVSENQEKLEPSVEAPVENQLPTAEEVEETPSQAYLLKENLPLQSTAEAEQSKLQEPPEEDPAESAKAFPPIQPHSEYGDYPQVISQPSTRNFHPTHEESTARIYELLQKGGSDLNEALLLIRKLDLEKAEEETRQKMVLQGRCPQCTLKLPCKHYKLQSELPKPKKVASSQEFKDSFIFSISTLHNSDIPRLKPLPPSNIESGSDLRRSKKNAGNLTVRYRSVNNVTYKRSNPDRSFSRYESTKAEERKLKLMDKLDRYREEKLRKEIEKIEEMKRREEEEKKQELLKELKRRERHKLIKNRLQVNQEKLMKAQEERKLQALAEQKKQLKDEKRRKKYYQSIKTKLEEHHKKKQMIEGIQRDALTELEEDTLKPKEDSN